MPFDALGYRFELVVDDPTLDAYLRRLFDALPRSARVDHEVVVRSVGDGSYEVGGRRVPGLAELAGAVVQTVNAGVLAADPTFILIHGAAARLGEELLALPAETESGKSTLVAALVQRGFAYLTDETIAIDPAILEVVAYPKPISLDPGSWTVLPELQPDVPADYAPLVEGQWQVPPRAFRAEAVGAGGKLTAIVFPRFEMGAATTLVPLGRADALAELAPNVFNLHRHGRDGFARLGEVMRGCRCFRLTHGSVHEAVPILEEMVRNTLGA